ncbi:hypothetical protein BT69DRAFT_572264 [Atractiella rhizophila]|nr:hypothetical protein BT69DRAFT_572264 [Atractiella rhizophila]
MSTEKKKDELIPTKLDSPFITSFYTEKQLSEKVKSRARTLCAEQMQRFVECTKENNFTAPFRPSCRAALKEANECLRRYNTPEEVDKLRLEFSHSLSRKGSDVSESSSSAVPGSSTSTSTSTTTPMGSGNERIV